jgi:hypothetical protein
MKGIKTIIFTTCVFAVSVSSASSQPNLKPIRGLDLIISELNSHKANEGRADMTYENTTGTPFMFPDFHTGKLILKSGESTVLDMRYDAYADQIHIRMKGSIYGISKPDNVALIKIDTVSFIYSKIDKRGAKSDGAYFVLKTDGKCKLLIKKRMILKAAEPEKPYQPAVPATFVPARDLYFFKLDDGKAILIRTKGDILSVLADKKDEMIRFISTNKTGTKPEDLVRIVDYYNSL